MVTTAMIRSLSVVVSVLKKLCGVLFRTLATKAPLTPCLQGPRQPSGCLFLPAGSDNFAARSQCLHEVDTLLPQRIIPLRWFFQTEDSLSTTSPQPHCLNRHNRLNHIMQPKLSTAKRERTSQMLVSGRHCAHESVSFPLRISRLPTPHLPPHHFPHPFFASYSVLPTGHGLCRPCFRQT